MEDVKFGIYPLTAFALAQVFRLWETQVEVNNDQIDKFNMYEPSRIDYIENIQYCHCGSLCQLAQRVMATIYLSVEPINLSTSSIYLSAPIEIILYYIIITHSRRQKTQQYIAASIQPQPTKPRPPTPETHKSDKSNSPEPQVSGSIY